MKGPLSARVLGARAVARVLDEHITLDRALAEALRAADAVTASAARSLSYGAVRGYFRHQALLERLSSAPLSKLEPTVRALLSVALYEIEDARTPEYAVVDAAVETAKTAGVGRAAGLINALLRRYLRERAALDAQIAADGRARYAAPGWLAAQARADWPQEWQSILAALDAKAPMWLRVNARRADGAEYRRLLEEARLPAAADAPLPFALQLKSPCEVTELPGFAHGWVSVQDLGAQCVAAPLDLRAGQRILDACAAPGGKTALIAERMPELAALVAVDIDAQRLARVRDNLERGSLSAQLLCGDAGAPGEWWDGKPFDRILLDAPCSSLGVVRRRPDIRLRKSRADLDKLPHVQSRLLRALWPLLRSGGRLVYATCTFTRAENRAVIAAFLDATPDAAVVPAAQWAGWPAFGIDDGIGRQILPGEAGADGFYYAALTKR